MKYDWIWYFVIFLFVFVSVKSALATNCTSPLVDVGGFCINPEECPSNEFIVNSSGIFCYQCIEGFRLVNGSCVPIMNVTVSSGFVSQLDSWGARIFPQAPILGILVLFGGITIIFFWLINKLKKGGLT